MRSHNFAVTFRLRDFATGDFETLFEIDQACYEPAIAYSRGELRRYLRSPGADCIVAESAGAVIGFCLTARQRDRGHVITIDVLEPCRRQGAGSALLAETERHLAAAGVRRVSLETATNNAPAIAFWERHGYRILGVRKGYYPGGRDAYAMAKLLS